MFDNQAEKFCPVCKATKVVTKAYSKETIELLGLEDDDWWFCNDCNFNFGERTNNTKYDKDSDVFKLWRLEKQQENWNAIEEGIEKYGLQDVAEITNYGVIVDNKYCFYVHKKKAFVKGKANSKKYQMKGFDHFANVFLKDYINKGGLTG